MYQKACHLKTDILLSKTDKYLLYIFEKYNKHSQHYIEKPGKNHFHPGFSISFVSIISQF